MRTLMVVFHDPDDDRTGNLNQCLENKKVSVGPGNEVACLKFPDGCLIICYDQEPSEHVQQVIAAKIKEYQPERKLLLVHKSTWKNNIDAARAQHALTGSGGVLEGARSAQQYSHEVGNPFYDGLINILSHSHLADLFPAFDEAEKKNLRQEFSHLKHDVGRTLCSLDIDLQGLVASNFDSGYKREIVETYQGAPGKATSALERVRELVHDKSFSIRSVALEVIKLINPDPTQKQQIGQAWDTVVTLLPATESKPTEIYWILQSLESEEGLNQLEKQQTPDKIFHEWFSSLDEALNVLRDLTTAKIPANTNQTTGTT